jgi:hypothetical protein
MPGPYGSTENPVVLDPFRTIVEVGWASRYLAVQIGKQLEVGLGDQETGGGGPAFVEPFTLSWADSVQVVTPPAGSGVGSAWIGGRNGWNGVNAGDVTPSGIPDPAEVVLGYWLWNAADGTGGGDDPIDSPGGVPFDGGLDTGVKIFGQAIVEAGSPNDVPFAFPSFPGKWGTGASSGGEPTITEITTQAFDLSGFSAEFNGKTYQAIATAVVPAGGGNATGTLLVLMEREAVTA